MPFEPETDELKVTVEGETNTSYHLKCGEKSAYFPKSQVSFKRRNVKSGEAVAEIPIWLLKDRGWDKPGAGTDFDDMPEEGQS